MTETFQQPQALDAAKMLARRYFSTVGNAEKLKVRVFRSPRGKQIAVILTNAKLTVMTEPVYKPTLPMAKYHKRRYGENESRNSNLNFAGSRLGKGSSADCWVFPDQSELEQFLDWYQTL